MNTLQSYIRASSGRQEADLVFKNAGIINVFTEEILVGDVAVKGDTIVGIGEYHGVREIDCTGKYICPGFIDAHVHMESAMVLPFELARAVLPTGTTTLIADPHEIVNVRGAKAVEFLLEASENIPLNVFLMLPSAVPATAFETNGSSFTAEEMKPFINHPRVLGLGEVMCFHDVVEGKSDIMQKLTLNRGRIIDGHAPDLSGKALQAYVCAGVETEHECTSFEEAYEKVRAGLKILVREGSAAKNLETIVTGLVKSGVSTENFLLCTDDKHLDDIEREGHINWAVRRTVQCGLNPVKAIKMATYNAARTYGLKRLGAVAAGYRADLVILDDLQQIAVNSVYKDGLRADEELFRSNPFEMKAPGMLNTVRFQPVTTEQLQMRAGEKDHVIGIVPNQILTKHLIEKIPQENGYFVPGQEYSKLCVVERHRDTGRVAVAALKGFGIRNGAAATSVAHDSHNILAAGDNDADIITAINHIRKIQGGYVLVSGGKVLAELPLPVAGLISVQTGREVQAKIGHMIGLARSMGVPEHVDPFHTLSFLALPVIPQIRLTDLGLIDVEQFCIIDR